jgi:hypothetical protein
MRQFIDQWLERLRAWWERRATLSPMPPAMMNMDGYHDNNGP